MVIRVEQGKGPEGSLRDALAQTAGYAAQLLAGRAAEGIGSSRVIVPANRSTRAPSNSPAKRPVGSPASASPITPHSPAARLRSPFAGIRHGRPHHPTAARPPQPGDHRSIPADCHQQGVFHLQSARPAPASHSRCVGTRHAPALLSVGPMDRPKLEVADVFRRYGEAYREKHGASMSTAQRRVMTAIEVCRTAALGGQIEQCDQCGHQRICLPLLPKSPLSQVSVAGSRGVDPTTGKPNFSIASTSTLCSRCRKRLPRSPTRTRRQSTAFSSGPRPKPYAP